MGGLSLEGYKLVIKTSTGTFLKDLTYCDAETNSLIKSARSCSVPVLTLRAAPFNLLDFASVIAKVTAFN